MATGIGPPSKKQRSIPADNDHEDIDYDVAVAALQAEWKKGKKKRSLLAIKDLMMRTERGRRSWISKERPMISDVLSKYPCLSKPRSVSWLLRT